MTHCTGTFFSCHCVPTDCDQRVSGFDEGDAAGADDGDMAMVAPLANLTWNSTPVFAATMIALARSGSETGGCGGGGKGGKAAAADEGRRRGAFFVCG